MKSRLITALAIGALAAGLLPGVASAAPDLSCAFENPVDSCSGATGVVVEVTTGTTLEAPAEIDMTAAFPGQIATSNEVNFTYWSNEGGKTISGVLDGNFVRDNQGGGDATTIDSDNVEVSSPDYGNYSSWYVFDTVRPIEDIVDVQAATDEDGKTATLKLRVHIPSATEGHYNATMTWSLADTIN